MTRLCNLIWNILMTKLAVIVIVLCLVLLGYLIHSENVTISPLVKFDIQNSKSEKCLTPNGSTCLYNSSASIVKSYLLGSMVLLGFETIQISFKERTLVCSYVLVVYLCYFSTQISCVFLAMQLLQLEDLIRYRMERNKYCRKPLKYSKTDFSSNKCVIVSSKLMKMLVLVCIIFMILIGGLYYFKLTLQLKYEEAFVLWSYVSLRSPVNFMSFYQNFFEKLSYNSFTKYFYFLFFIIYLYSSYIARLCFLFLLGNTFARCLKRFTDENLKSEFYIENKSGLRHKQDFGNNILCHSNSIQVDAFEKFQFLEYSNQNIEYEEESTAF